MPAPSNAQLAVAIVDYLEKNSEAFERFLAPLCKEDEIHFYVERGGENIGAMILRVQTLTQQGGPKNERLYSLRIETA